MNLVAGNESYIFKSGKFKNKSVQQIFLTRYAELRNFIKFAMGERNLNFIVNEYFQLEEKIKMKKFKCKYCENSASILCTPNGRQNLLVCEECMPSSVIDYFDFPNLSYRDSLIFPSFAQNRKFCSHLWQSLGLGNINRKTVSEFFS